MDQLAAMVGGLEEAIRGLEKKVPFASALVKINKRFSIRCSKNEVQVSPQATDAGIVVTVFNGRQFFEWAQNDIFKGEVLRWVESLAESIPSAGPTNRLKFEDFSMVEKHFRNPMTLDPQDISLNEKVDWTFGKLSKLLGSHSSVVNAHVGYSENHQQTLYVSKSKTLSQKITQLELRAMPYLSRDQKTVSIYTAACRSKGFEMTQDFLTDQDIKVLINDGEKLLHASRIESGEKTLVFDPGFSGLLAHEAFGHGMESDLFLQGRAQAAGSLGQKVASELVTLIDDPTMPFESGSYVFDDEGHIATPTLLMDRGVLKTPMTDAFSSLLLGLKRSANGRRASVFRKPYARMSNTYFQAGGDRKEDLIKGVENGLYLSYPTNGMEDPLGWGMQLEGLMAEEIKSGKLTGKVFSPVIVTGYVPEVLTSIDGVANDLQLFGSGYCGKGHKEYLKTSCGGPSLRLKARVA